jgi:hypothetical protein
VQPTLFEIDNSFSVTDVGTVVRCDGLRCWWSRTACAQVTGIALQGKVEVGSTFMLGPWSAPAVRAPWLRGALAVQ